MRIEPIKSVRCGRPSDLDRHQSASAADEDGDVGLREHAHRFAAEQQASEPAAAMGGHDDQIAAGALGRVEHAFCGMVLADVNAVAVDTGRSRSLADLVEDLLCLLVGELLEITGWKTERCFARQPAAPRLRDGHGRHLRAEVLGEFETGGDRLGGEIRPVRRNEDVLVHGASQSDTGLLATKHIVRVPR